MGLITDNLFPPKQDKTKKPLSEFVAAVKTGALARSNRFSVGFSLPTGVKPVAGSLQKVLLLCDQVQLPGMSHATAQNRSFGEYREVPYERLYGDITMSFYVDNDMHVKQLFDNWMNAISDPTRRTFNYYKYYTTQITVDVEDLNNNSRYKVTMEECYPKSIGPVQLDYASKDIMKLSVQMQYKYWKSESLTATPTEDSPTNFLDKYVKDFTGWQASLPEGAQKLTGAVATYGVTKLPGLLKF